MHKARSRTEGEGRGQLARVNLVPGASRRHTIDPLKSTMGGRCHRGQITSERIPGGSKVVGHRTAGNAAGAYVLVPDLEGCAELAKAGS